jgi:solute carrier family 25 (mitochondrial carnitine/acylcarnitine transporter), member 20/29
MIDGEYFIGFVGGIASGATKLLIGHPFDTIKVRMQTEGGFGRFKGPLDCIRSTVKKEGFRAMYKGATPPSFGWALMDSVQMGSLTNFRMLLKYWKGGDDLTIAEYGLAGMGAGVVVSFVATPIEVVKARLQVQYDSASTRYKGPIDCVRKLYQQDGIRGPFKGLSGCLLFRSFFFILWGSYEFYTRQLERLGVHDRLVPFFAGGLAANSFWVISFPADVIKNRLMIRSSSSPYQTIRQCVGFVFRTEGLKGFYRGFVPCFLRSFPTNASAIFVFETISKFGRGL